MKFSVRDIVGQSTRTVLLTSENRSICLFVETPEIAVMTKVRYEVYQDDKLVHSTKYAESAIDEFNKLEK